MNKDKAVAIAWLLLRVVTGLMFFHDGSVKTFAWFGGMPGTPPGTTAPLLSQIGIGGVLETYGGIAILLGLFTRPIAFILSGEMAVAYWQFHAPNGTWPVQNHGEGAVLYCFIFLFMSAFGGGAWSVDGLLAKRKQG